MYNVSKMLVFCISVFFFFSNSNYAQEFTGFVVMNNNDTIKCTFDVQTNLFDKNMFYPTSVIKKVKIINEKNEKIKYFPHEIKSFTLKNSTSKGYRFVSIDADKRKNFYEEIILGKISVYRSYIDNMQMGDFPNEKTFYCKDNIIGSRETIFFNFRNWFGRLIEDYPELYQKWMDSDKYFKKNQVFEVVKIYNDKFKI